MTNPISANYGRVSNQRTIDIITATGAGATPGGEYSLSILNSGGTAVIIAGESIPANVSVDMDGGGGTLQPITYDATGGQIKITRTISA